jgi:MFS family permease
VSSSSTAPVRPVVMVAGATCLLVAAMFASFAPTPLYPLYDDLWHIGPLGTSVAFAGYPIGVIVVVLGVGGLSDRIGRQRTMLVAAAVIVVALLLTSTAGSLTVLTTGRLLQGAGTGLAGSTAAAALVDYHPRGAESGAFLHAIGSTVGMAVGPIMAGWLVHHTAQPLVVPFLVIAALTLVPVALLLVAGRDPAPVPGRRLVQSISVPAPIWRAFSVAALSLLVVNGCNGLYGAFSSRVVEEGLRSSSALATGRLMTLLIVALGVGQLLLQRVPRALACRTGLVGVAVGMGVAALGVHQASSALTVLGTALIGFAGGVAFLGSTRLIATIAPPAQRAEIYGGWMVVGFTAMAAGSLLSGSLLHGADLTSILLGGTVLAAAVAGYVVLLPLHPRPRPLGGTT